MIKYYFHQDSAGFYQTDINDKIPSGAFEITELERWEMVNAISQNNSVEIVNGSVVISPKASIPTPESERAWRNLELLRSDIELNKVQDSDPKAIGSVSDWRSYRKALRAWPEHKDFPIKDKRPLAPDA